MMAMAMAMANETAHQPTPMMQLYWQSTTPVQAASCVLTVPIAFEEASRAALADAAVIAGLVPLAIIDDTTAAAIYYGVCRDSSLFPASPDSSAEKAAASPDGAATPAKHVLFVDMGSQYLNVSLVEYRKSALRVVATAHDTVGGWHLTNEIASHVASVLKVGYVAISLSLSLSHALTHSCRDAAEQTPCRR